MSSAGSSKDASIAAATAAADQAIIDSLRKDVDAERKRADKLDALLITNASLRKRLQDELDNTRSHCEMMAAQVEAARGSASADVAKHLAEANSYKQMYLQALEELSTARSTAQRLTVHMNQVEEERDQLRKKMEEQTAELETFSPKRPACPEALEYNIAEVEADLGQSSPQHRVEPLLWDEDEPHATRGDHPQFGEAAAGADEASARAGEGPLKRLSGSDLQRVVVGLYRRLKACEVVLHETNQARVSALSKSIDLQREVEHLQRRLAVKSPMVVRREAAAASAADRPISAPRRLADTPSSAARPVSALRSQATISRSTSASKQAGGARPTSAVPSARSTSATSMQSHAGSHAVAKGIPAVEFQGPLRLNAFQLKEEFRIRPKSPYGSSGVLSALSRGVPPPSQQHLNITPIPSAATSTVNSRRVSPVRPGATTAPHSIKKSTPSSAPFAAPMLPKSTVVEASTQPAPVPALNTTATTFRAVLRGAFTEHPPIIGRKQAPGA